MCKLGSKIVLTAWLGSSTEGHLCMASTVYVVSFVSKLPIQSTQIEPKKTFTGRKLTRTEAGHSSSRCIPTQASSSGTWAKAFEAPL